MCSSDLDENGSYHFTFNSGDKPDDTSGSGELGSHGLIAWTHLEGSVLGTKTLVIDSEVHEIDLVARSSAVTVLMTLYKNRIRIHQSNMDCH